MQTNLILVIAFKSLKHCFTKKASIPCEFNSMLLRFPFVIGNLSYMMNILGMLLLFLANPVTDEPKKPSSIRDQLPTELVNEIRSLETDYGIVIELVQSSFVRTINSDLVISGEPATVEATIAYLPGFIKEWRLYPREFIKKLRVDRVSFCCFLQSVNLKTLIGGTVDPSTNSLYYLLFGERSNKNDDWLVRTRTHIIHHEMFHFIDHRLRGDIHVDPMWEKLNPTSFSYFHLKKWDPHAMMVTSLFPGFITRYAENSLFEDKAETFGFMMLNLHEMECRGKDDVILGRKMGYLKQVLKSYCAEIDQSFWTNIRCMNRLRLTSEGDPDPWAIAHPTLPALPKLEEPTPVVVNETYCHLATRRTLICHRLRRCCR